MSFANAVYLRRLTVRDIVDVVENLWERGEREAERFGLKGKSELLDYILDADGEHQYCICQGLNKVAVMGANYSPESHKYNTWFVATRRFELVGLSATRLLKRFLKDSTAKHPGAEVELLSASDHAAAERWFGVLGFRKIAEEGVFTKYAYQKG